MTAIIVDEEALDRKRIKKLLLKSKEINIIKECSNGLDAIREINELKPDIIFLEINLKDIDGFKVIENIKNHTPPFVIFVSSFNHAVKAFEYEALDFILKPFEGERFFKTMNKVMQRVKYHHEDFRISQISNFKIHENIGKSRENPSLFIPVRHGSKTLLVDPKKVKYLLASGSYVEIYTKDKKHVVRSPLNHLQSLFDSCFFCRVHRSAIININYIQEIIHGEYSELDVKMRDNRIIRISKSKKKKFLENIGM